MNGDAHQHRPSLDPDPPNASSSASLSGHSRAPGDVDPTEGIPQDPTSSMDQASRGQEERRSSSAFTAQDTRSGNHLPTSDPEIQRRTSHGSIEGEDKSSPREDRMSDESSRSPSDNVEMSDMPSEDEGLEDDEETGLTGKDRRRRRQRKRHHARLESRIVGEPVLPKEEQLLANQSVLTRSLVNAVLIAMWYLFSLSISIYNKWMFGPTHLNFNFPLFATSFHMLVQFTLSSLVLYFIPRFRPRLDSLSNPNNLPSRGPSSERRDSAGNKKPLMTRWFYISRIGPCGSATGLDIGLGNMSLHFISLTFFTMCKSSALAFVLLFAFVFGLETPSIKLVLIIFTMTIGVIMMVAGEVAFDALGFILIISSAFFSGFRWALTQILLLRNPATSNPFSSIFFLAPIMFASLLVIAVPVEGLPSLIQRISELMAERGVLLSLGMLLFPGILAFLMTSSEFALLQRTSVVTLSICGIFKEVVTISAAGLVYHDPLTTINVSGLIVTIASIATYNYMKIVKMRHDARVYSPVLATDDLRDADEPLDATSSLRRVSASSSILRRTLGVTIPASLRGGDKKDAPSSRVSPARRLRPEDDQARRND